MQRNEKNNLKVSLFFAFLVPIYALGLFGLAAFAIREDFQGSWGVRIKDWIEVTFEGSPKDKPSELPPAPEPPKNEGSRPQA